jgi:peptidoglycan/LPS O-acetylase OafA/YrhL
MAELPDQGPAAAGHGGLRASRADRERVIGTLKAAFVQGHLDQDEFGLRVDQVLASRTYAELAVIAADLPAGLTGDAPSRPAPPASPAPAPGGRRVLRPRRTAAAATALYLALWPLALLLMPTSGIDGEPNDAFNLMGVATLVYIFALIVIGLWSQAAGPRQEGPNPAA